MASTKRSITIKDVAKAAGVSVSTVSRVINDKDDVSVSTSEHVKGIIEKMGYTSSLAAKSMRSRETNVLGLVMSDIAEPFGIQVMKGVNKAIVEFDYSLMIYTNGDFTKNATAANEQEIISLLNNGMTDGAIVVTPTASSFISPAPLVAIDPNHNIPDLPSVIASNYKGAVDAVTYLIELGHQRIGYIEGRENLVSSQERTRGFKDTLQAHGIPLDEDLITNGNFVMETSIECARQLLSVESPPTAIFAANDESAKGVYQVADEMGLSIPEDISVIGFDNTWESRYMGLTTVDQFIEEMGFIGIKILVDLINGIELDDYHHIIETKLIIRDSCKAI